MKSIFRLRRQLRLTDYNIKTTRHVKAGFYLVIIKSIRIWSFSGLYFPSFEMNTEIYWVNPRIKFKRENTGQRNSEYGQLFMQLLFPGTDYKWKHGDQSKDRLLIYFML